MLKLKALYVVLLGAVSLVDSTTVQNITSDTYFYGQSPPVYPSPVGKGTGDWASAYAKAAAMVSKMTLEEKSNLTFGIPSETNGCSGNIPPIARLGFPGLCWQNAGNGVAATDFVNSYPSGLHVGASWNKALAYQRALAMGGEFRTKGVNVALGPVVAPLGRIAEGGRNWEGFSNDPYLCGSLVFETVRGIQERGVITSTKHFIGYEQETNRIPSTNLAGMSVNSVSSNIDDKTMHELYLWPFQDAVHAGSGTIMCSYNRINNSAGCGNSKTLNGLLKTELGFNGFVVSDWYGQYAGVATTLAGLDMTMPNEGFWGSSLVASINNGSVPISRLDDMVTRIIAAWYKMGQDKGYPAPGAGIPVDILKPHMAVNARESASKEVLLDGAIEGHVLVKNIKNALPLKSPKLLSLFGYDTKAPDQNNPPSGLTPWAFGFESANILEALPGFLGTPLTVQLSQIAINGTIISGGGSGANSPAYINAPFDALQERAYRDNSTVLWDFVNVNATAAVDGASDACLVFVNAFSSEGFDRVGIHDDYSDALVNNIADQCSNTIVIIHNAGVRLVDQFIDHPNVTAVIFAHLPGQDSGRALVSILYGDSSPSGKLPYSVPMNESAYNSLLSPSLPTPPFNLFPQSDFTEGMYIDYRAFDAKNITPRYEFGFGLSYTTFFYSNLQIDCIACVGTRSIAEYPAGAILEGGMEDLWDVLVKVTATVENSGSADGAEVSQLYLGIPGAPVRQLRGYSKEAIPPGKRVTVEFDLTRRDLSVWDTTRQSWKLQSGTYTVYVGGSSRNLPLTKTLKI
ncbi:glycoside hydrolase family 3 protein [Oidiodendron maius Zn]|uniref:beta-glucosidase n=1 Tax=Oidiodendron maius (strain Zn) TaxID=913774 RepID=A0A0C3GVA6_OIDMZ|nr:glycoside hydrolase family 3 protein [Oidiodendron maius Zn]